MLLKTINIIQILIVLAVTLSMQLTIIQKFVYLAIATITIVQMKILKKQKEVKKINITIMIITIIAQVFVVSGSILGFIQGESQSSYSFTVLLISIFSVLYIDGKKNKESVK